MEGWKRTGRTNHRKFAHELKTSGNAVPTHFELVPHDCFLFFFCKGSVLNGRGMTDLRLLEYIGNAILVQVDSHRYRGCNEPNWHVFRIGTLATLVTAGAGDVYSTIGVGHWFGWRRS